MKPRVYIGFDVREEIAYDVLKYSLEKNTSRPIDIFPLKLKDLAQTIDFKRPLDPLQSSDFTYSRFLVPYLCGFKGKAIFMDCDMLCLGDICEIFDLDLSSYWLRVVKHDHRPTSKIKMDGKIQTVYPRKNWSSFMLLNCEKLTLWTKDKVEKESAKWLHRFEAIPDECIGEIARTWNVLDCYNSDTKLVHYTEGGPWFENYKNHPYGDVWLKYEKELAHLRNKILTTS